MGSSRRWGIRALAVLAVTFLTVLALATAASAETRVFVQPNVALVQLECLQKGGSWIPIPAATPGGIPGGVCVFPDGGIWICQGGACVANTPRKNVQALLNDIRDVGGRSVREPSEHSKGWVQTGPKNINTVGVMGEAGCRELGGEFVSTEGAVGQCRTPTATVVCQNITSKNTCVGLADTAKHASSTRKKIRTVLKTSSTTTPGGSTTTTGSTTTSGSTTTTGATTTTRGTTPSTRG
jgi:hypothetical protein